MEYGTGFSAPVKNAIRLSLEFAKAAGRAQPSRKNMIVAPLALALSLGMMARGAEGGTKAEIARKLFNTGPEWLEDNLDRLKDLDERIARGNQGDVTLRTALGAWSNYAKASIDYDFSRDAARRAGGLMSSEIFGKDDVTDDINRWSAQKTGGFVNRLVDGLSPEDNGVVASGVHFSGTWSESFDPARPARGEFGDWPSAYSTPFMRKNITRMGNVRYLNGSDYEAVALTYGEDNPGAAKSPPMRAIFIRPRAPRVTAADWLKTQPSNGVPPWLDFRTYREAAGSLEMPRIDLDEQQDFSAALKEFGIRNAFSASADFSGMTSQPLSLSKVLQHVSFKADEDGVKPQTYTPYTGYMYGYHPVPAQNRLDFKLDRSFVFALQDIKTGAVVMLGTIADPNGDLKPLPRPVYP